MSNETFQAPPYPTNNQEVYLDAILRGLNNISPAPEIPAPVWRIEQYLAAIAQAILNGGGGSSLPSVTSADNGKVLAVNDGAWAADANTFVITASGSPRTIDKTVDEILAALDAGKAVYLVDGEKTYTYLGKDSSSIYFAVEYYGNIRYYSYIALSNAKITNASYPKLPLAFASDNGSELIVKNGNWAKQQKKLIVTLTPTAEDFSGTMDKTPQEITAAYKAGQEIVFNVVGFPGFDHVYIPAAWYTYATDMSRCAACATLVDVTTGLQIVIVTSDGGSSTYFTKVYSLTPAS